MHASAPQPTDPPVGGRYELLGPIGEGNFSVTYRARDITLGRIVAVKLLRAQYAADPTFVARFEREAQVAASVSHPNVVDVYDYGRHGDTFFIAMQYVPGRTLKHALDDEGRFAAERAVRVAREILAGLSAIHAAGIVHRDIKPQNVLLGQDNSARVTDFGVAHGPLGGVLTTHGTTVGTASYMAPEQARGGAVEPATDLYAVGVVLFELLTGRLPFVVDNPMAVMLAHLQQPPPRPSEVAPDAAIPPSLEAEVMRALAKDPAARHAGAEAMSSALAQAIGEPAGTRLTAPSEPWTAGTTTRLPVADGDRTVALDAAPPGYPRESAAGQRPVSVPPVLPQPRRRRGAPAWLAPLALAAIALVIVGTVLSSGGLPGGGDGDDGDNPAAGSTAAAIAPAATETPRPTAISIQGQLVPTATAPPLEPTLQPAPTTTPTEPTTATPQPTEPPAPTETPQPSETPSPEPTSPPEPTPEPTPVEVATDPAIVPVDEAPVVPDDPAAIANDAASPGTIATFAASDWQGGYSDGGTDPYGRPWVAIFGAQSPFPSASLTFTLSDVPDGGIVLSLFGLDDDLIDSEVPISMTVNGQIGQPFDSPFKDQGSGGIQYPWVEASVSIPAAVLKTGQNTITLANGAQSSNTDGAPYILFSDARISLPEDDVTSGLTGNASDARRTNGESDADRSGSNSGSG